MPDNVTVTAKTGPGTTATARLFSPAQGFSVNLAGQVLSVQAEGRNWDFDLYGVATVTYTIASHVGTIAFS